MDNFLPFSSSNANSFQEFPMDLNNDNLNFSMISSFDHQLPQPQPYSYGACPVDQTPPTMAPPQPFHSSEAFAFPPHVPFTQTGSEFGSVVNYNYNQVSRLGRGGYNDSDMMKRLARINRKQAMRRSRNNACPNPWFNQYMDPSTQFLTLDMMRNNSEVVAPREDLYRYSALDNKKLRVLLVKHLKNSDVGTLGRIVLPKRDAEANLPELTEKEGMKLEMRDADSTQSWSFRYKYWCNNKSRMYVLENTGDFVKNTGAQMGDYLTIYEDESKHLYYSITKIGNQNDRRRAETIEMNDMMKFYENMMSFDYPPNDEEEDSIAMLLGNLNDQYPNPNDFMNFSFEFDQHNNQATSSLPPVDHVTDPTHVGPSNEYVNFEDFVW